jgi:raffinose/stachyose/melibiose transport system permease protein
MTETKGSALEYLLPIDTRRVRRSTPTAHARRRRVAWAFMLPLVVVNLLVILVPSCESIYYAFTNWNGVGRAKFVGGSNFAAMFTSSDFWTACLHNALWTAFFLVVPMAMGLAGAFMLSRIHRFQVLFRVIYFVPYILATIVTSIVWENLLSPQDGIGFGLSKLVVPFTNVHVSFLNNVAFLGSTRTALLSVAFINNWQWWGFLVLMFLAAMQGTDPSLYEAARLDGANGWREFWHVTLPSIRPVLIFLALMTIIWSFLVFDYIYIITQGGPANSTQVVTTLMYNEAFSDHAAGYASAMGVFLGVISVVVVFAYTRLRKRGWSI